MKRRTPIKELEMSEAALARLRDERTRLDAEIAKLELRREADALQLVMATMKRLNLAQLPAASILAALEQLAQSANVDRPVDPGGTIVNSDDPREDLVPVIVRLTRNTSVANLDTLARERLCWNGRAGGWSGRVTFAALERLRDVFPGRIETPSNAKSSAAVSKDEANGPAVEAEATPIASFDAPLVNVEAEASAVAPAEEPDDAEAAVPPTQPAVPAATRLMTSPFRVLPPRRPLSS